MSKRRLSSVPVLAATPAADNYVSKTVSVRKIDNGFVRSTSESGPDGYKSSETFHRSDPGLKMRESRDSAGSNSGALRDAIAHCKGEDCK